MFGIDNMGLSFCQHYGYPCDLTSLVIVERYINEFMSRYEYEGFSDDFNELYGNANLFEFFMFFAPAVAWYEHPTKGVIALPVTGKYEYNIVGKPTKWTVWGVNGLYNRELNEKNSVLMYNDQAKTIPFLHINHELDFMRKLNGAMRQNIDLQSTPYIIEAYDENQKTANTWINMLNTFKSRIVLRKRRDKDLKSPLEESKVLNTNVELKVKDLITAYNEFDNRCLTYLGIKNVNIEKSERLLTGEVSANDMLIQLNYTNSLDQRQKALESVNKMFGTNYKVKPRELHTLQSDITSAYQQQNQSKIGGDKGENDSITTN